MVWDRNYTSLSVYLDLVDASVLVCKDSLGLCRN